MPLDQLVLLPSQHTQHKAHRGLLGEAAPPPAPGLPAHTVWKCLCYWPLSKSETSFCSTRNRWLAPFGTQAQHLQNNLLLLKHANSLNVTVLMSCPQREGGDPDDHGLTQQDKGE